MVTQLHHIWIGWIGTFGGTCNPYELDGLERVVARLHHTWIGWLGICGGTTAPHMNWMDWYVWWHDCTTHELDGLEHVVARLHHT